MKRTLKVDYTKLKFKHNKGTFQNTLKENNREG